MLSHDDYSSGEPVPSTKKLWNPFSLAACLSTRLSQARLETPLRSACKAHPLCTLLQAERPKKRSCVFTPVFQKGCAC